MDTARIDSQLEKLKNFEPRRATPAALKVKIDDKEKSFLIDPATGKVRQTPAAYGWTLGFDFKELKRFFLGKGYEVKEVMGEVVPVLS